MPVVEVPFGDIDKPIEPGLYKAEVTGAQLKKVTKPESKFFGSAMINWEFTITEAGPQMGRKVTYNSNLSDQVKLPDGSPDVDTHRRSAYFLREFLKTLGVEYNETNFNTEAAYHAKAVLKITNATYNGREISNVEQVMPYNE